MPRVAQSSDGATSPRATTHGGWASFLPRCTWPSCSLCCPGSRHGSWTSSLTWKLRWQCCSNRRRTARVRHRIHPTCRRPPSPRPSRCRMPCRPRPRRRHHPRRRHRPSRLRSRRFRPRSRRRSPLHKCRSRRRRSPLRHRRRLWSRSPCRRHHLRRRRRPHLCRSPRRRAPPRRCDRLRRLRRRGLHLRFPPPAAFPWATLPRPVHRRPRRP